MVFGAFLSEKPLKTFVFVMFWQNTDFGGSGKTFKEFHIKVSPAPRANPIRFFQPKDFLALPRGRGGRRAGGEAQRGVRQRGVEVVR